VTPSAAAAHLAALASFFPLSAQKIRPLEALMTDTPRGLRAAGKRLWEAVTSTFDLDPPEAALLEEACRTRDLLADLRREIAQNAAVIDSSQGPRVHPAMVEARQQRLVLAKLLAGLGLPKGLVDDKDDAA
jgi:hypothetical protein